jgi:hypothetical protein
MATTTNYGWTVPTSADLVKNGATAISTLGQNIDTTTKALNPSTTLGDIEYRSSTSNTNTRLGIGSTGQVLTVAGGVPSWATPAGSGAGFTKVLAASFSNVADTGTTFDGVFTSTYDNYMVVFNNMRALTNTSNLQFQLRNAGSTQSTAYYGNSTVGSTVTTTSNASAFNIGQGFSDSTQQNSYVFTVYRNTNRLSWSFEGMTRNGNGGVNGGGFSDSIAANGSDGFILSASSGNITGKATIYGLAI